MQGIDVLPIYLINLERSEKRRLAMQDRLKALNLQHVLFKACDGRADWETLAPSVDIRAFERNTGRQVMKAEIGTYHSHLTVWKAFIGSGADVALVLEDDVVFHGDFADAVNLALAAKDRWDFLKLNKIRAKHPKNRGQIGAYQLNAYVGSATGLGAYLITRELAERLLPRLLPITRPIDHELDRIFVHEFRHYGLEPFPSHVDDGNESTITGTGFSDVRKFPKWKRLPNYLLRLRNLIGKWWYLTRNRR